ncbi:MAG: TetR/AcrR family transcriptional regulator [Reichenbachiella sp.]
MAKKYDLQEVLKKGVSLFSKKGYNKTGTDDILKEAGFPRSSFYHHFGSKEGFALKTITYYGQNTLAYMEEVYANTEDPSPLSKLKTFFFNIIDFSEARDFEVCCVIHQFSVEEAGASGPLQEESMNQYETWVELTAQYISKAQSGDELTTKYSAEEIAHYLFGQLYGLFTFTRLTRDSKRFKAVMAMAFDLLEK